MNGLKKTNLSNLQVLITRPAQQAEKLCQLIEQQDGRVILLPTIAIEYIESDNQPDLQAVLKKLAVQAIAIFISPNAVAAAHALLQKYALPWPEQLQIAAIGASTAQALTNLGVVVTLVPTEQFNSEGLLNLSALQKVQGQRIIIFRGEGGRELLSAILSERGAILTEAVVYRRVLPECNIQTRLTQWQQGGLDMLVCTSNTGLQNLVTIVGESARNWLMNMPLLVISERMAEFAQTIGFVKKPIVADNATDEAIVQALLTYCDSNK